MKNYIPKKGFRAFKEQSEEEFKGTMTKEDMENYFRLIVQKQTESRKNMKHRIIVQNAHMKFDSSLPFGIEFYTEEGRKMFDEALKAECERLYPNQNFEK